MTGAHLRRTAIGCVLLAAVLTALVVVRWPPLLAFDERVARSLHAYALAHPAPTRLLRVLSDWPWDPWTMRASAALACVWLWRRGERALARRFGAAVLAASVVSQGLKAAVGRERPVWPDPVDSAHFAAYPSGHALTATVVCGLLLWLLPRSRGARTVAVGGALVCVLGVGFSRLHLGVHWASDVLGGWLLGAALAAFAIGGAGAPRGGEIRTGTAGGGRSPASPTTSRPAR
ncbi:phosphatase PAP2 family protein [Streptomyces sp. NPDC059917]|uniref:phosphatase PAP2 family protein n=1 Tax=Streptomyces sp. NPDC059917 TaxID=3347002 RepID=UPI00364699AF